MTTLLSESARNYPGGEIYPQIMHPEAASGPMRIQHPGLSTIGEVLVSGVQDWLACRTDVLVLAVLYPLAALLLIGVIINDALLPFVFPICAGVALIGPLATIWFSALSRQRELDGVATSEAAAAIFESSRLQTIKRLAMLLLGLFALWIAAAGFIYASTMGNASDSGTFLSNVFTTAGGHDMIVIGILVGAVFALVALFVGLVAFPLALDREVSAGTAISFSLKVALANPFLALVWGGVIVAGLVIGAAPGLLGLAVTIPVLGHASWHLYRRLVATA